MDLVSKPFVSIVLPCYNEEAILEINLNTIIDFMKERNEQYDWEIVLVDDGSKDKTGEIAESFSLNYRNIKVIHHPTNLNLGNALKTGFKHSSGNIIVVLDVDLSYGVEYIELMVEKLIEDLADIVIASPYMKGGKVTGVPFSRRIMSRWVNRFMRVAAQDKYHTYTSMVRAYKGSFIQKCELKDKGL